MANSSLDIVELDFDSLRNSFKNFLRENEVFKDYDFEGSSMSVLLDVLAFNTSKNAFLVNMLMAEGFLDSAKLRSSAFSHAKELNYLPGSYKSAKARIRVSFEATGESKPYVIQKGQPFSTLIKNDSFTFTIPETITVSSANTSFEFETDVYEGVYVKDVYTLTDSSGNQRFEITNRNVDLDSLVVTVYEDDSSVGDQYQFATTLLGLTNKSKVFFVQPGRSEGYEVLFGDGNIGRKPKVGARIVLDYRVTQGIRANGARVFSMDFDPTGASELSDTPLVETLEIARGGHEWESINSIKYNAPRHFQAQERAVTATDYEVMLKSKFPEISSVFAYGGEDLKVPQYGKVFVSLLLSNSEFLPESKRREYEDFLRKRRPFGTRIVFLEPDLSYIRVDTRVRYDVGTTSKSPTTMRTLVTQAVQDFREENLNNFNVVLRGSKLRSAIDEADDSIISSKNEFFLYKKLFPDLTEKKNYVVAFGVSLVDDVPEKNPVHPFSDYSALFSSEFKYQGEQSILEDNGQGVVWISKTDGETNRAVAKIGSIDYDTGELTLDSFSPDSFGSSLKIFVRTRDTDIFSFENNVLTIEDDEINVTVEESRE